MNKINIDLLGEHFPLKVIGTEGFWLKFSPVWFQLMGWLLTIGAIDAIRRINNSISVRIILAISYVSIFFSSGDTMGTLLIF
ncbi:hypothetical protein [uncultured Desulfuromonas sp.]|uniref:hypothetical protein n=1 Tax=uncultured Desulfuromonas sp. TaxID=181013 RepID=UPI00374CBBEE